MGEVNIKLTGWRAVVAIIILFGLIGFRLVSMKDLTDDPKLMQVVYQELTYEYLPDNVERLKVAQASGDAQELEEAAQAVASTKVKIESVTGSAPLFGLSLPYDVVLKVNYSINDDSGKQESGTVFYLFEKRSLPGGWRFKRETSPVTYYLNFM